VAIELLLTKSRRVEFSAAAAVAASAIVSAMQAAKIKLATM
jgi:hypothetical protein